MTSASRRPSSTKTPPPRSSATCLACPILRWRSPAPRCGATTRCSPPTCKSSGFSALATPCNGLGSNTSIQDSYNLAWKLGAVLRGQAGPALLETYSTERAPVARQIVTRANQSSREFVQFFEVLGLMDAETEEQMREQIEERKANTPRGKAKRHALVEAMELKNYEFNAHGVDMGQFYESTAIVSNG